MRGTFLDTFLDFRFDFFEIYIGICWILLILNLFACLSTFYLNKAIFSIFCENSENVKKMTFLKNVKNISKNRNLGAQFHALLGEHMDKREKEHRKKTIYYKLRRSGYTGNNF